MVETITTLTNEEKIAIVQHHEKRNGKEYPLKLSAEKITPYARILGVCDYFYQEETDELSHYIHLLQMKKGVELDEQVCNFDLIEL